MLIDHDVAIRLYSNKRLRGPGSGTKILKYGPMPVEACVGPRPTRSPCYPSRHLPGEGPASQRQETPPIQPTALGSKRAENQKLETNPCTRYGNQKDEKSRKEMVTPEGYVQRQAKCIVDLHPLYFGGVEAR